MSHGHGGPGSTIEPNLTPLLDLVLQLLMLFMICGNYASESNDPVELARSQTARQLADTESTQPEDDFLFITVKPFHNADGMRDLALQEIGIREQQRIWDPGQTATARGLVESAYKKVIAKEGLSDAELTLFRQINVPINSEQDLSDHVKDSVRKDVVATFKDGDAYVIVPGEDAKKPDDGLLLWLQGQYKVISEKHNGQVNTAVVIRPDGNMDYAIVYRILKLCKDARFTNLKVRALIQKGIDS